MCVDNGQNKQVGKRVFLSVAVENQDDCSQRMCFSKCDYLKSLTKDTLFAFLQSVNIS